MAPAAGPCSGFRWRPRKVGQYALAAAAAIATCQPAVGQVVPGVEPQGDGLLPIFFMHGLNGDAGWFDLMQGWVREMDPHAVLFSFPIAEKKASLRNLWHQGQELMDQIRAKVAEQPSEYAGGYALVCHSQGALLCRTVVERMDDHRVHTLVALAGPQAGEFGIPGGWESYLPWARDQVFQIAYTAASQDHLSIANYWHDPRPLSWPFHPEADYWQSNTFLPVFNNDPNRRTQGWDKPKDDAEAARYRQNLLRLQKAIFTCSPADDQIIPYDSAIFNFYGASPGNGTIPLEQTKLWVDDWLGLRALSESGRLVRETVQGVCHDCWARNETIFRQHIAPRLPHRAAGALFGWKSEAALARASRDIIV